MIDITEEPLPSTIPKVKGKNVFRENWLKVDEVCPHCKQVTKRQRGITKQNLQRLITPKWDITELVITLMLIFVIVLAFAYKSETQTTRDWLKSMTSGDEETCKMVCSNKCNNFFKSQEVYGMGNYENFTIVSVNERTNVP